MRKVYQNESHYAGLPVAIIFGVGFTAMLFGFIPFAHRIATPQHALVLRNAASRDPTPPVAENTPPPPPEPEQPPEDKPTPPPARAQHTPT